MLTHDLISKVSKKRLLGTPVAFVDNRTGSPEQMLVQQYNEIVKCVDELDQHTFRLARNILREIAVSAPNNLAVRALTILANGAREEPTPEQCTFLENHAGKLKSYGLNPYLFIADTWSDKGENTREVEALKRNALGKDQIDVGDLNRLLGAFTKAGEPVESFTNFVGFCKVNNIAVEAHAIVREEQTSYSAPFCVSRAPQLSGPGGLIR
jgi:hypothetical protein